MLDSLVEECLEYFAVERGLSPNTITAYRRTLLRYSDFLQGEGIEVGAVTQKTVGDFALVISCGISPGSKAAAFTAVRMFHRFLVADGYADNNPATVLVSPKLPLRLPRALSIDQVNRLLDAPPNTVQGIRDRLILEMLYATGMRVSELVGLNLGDVDLEDRIVTCRGKGDKWRRVPFGRSALTALQTYLNEVRPRLENHDRKALIVNKWGDRLTRAGCYEVVEKWGRRAGIDVGVYPHLLRHTFATHLLEGGANLLVIQKLLGHSSIETTQIYTAVRPEHLRRTYSLYHPRAFERVIPLNPGCLILSMLEGTNVAFEWQKIRAAM